MSNNNSDSESDNSKAQIHNIDGFSDNEAGSDAENENFGEHGDFYMPLSDQPDRLSDSEEEVDIPSPGDVTIEQFEADVKFTIETTKIEDELKEIKKLSAEKRTEELNKKALADFDRRYYEEVENSIAGHNLPPKLLDPLPRDTTDDIKEVMNSIRLSYVPDWAKEVVEDEWLGPLIQQIMNMNAKETESTDDFFDQSNNNTNDNNGNNDNNSK